jgi:hypothetical protein
MFSKPKVQKGIPRLKHRKRTDAETQQPIIRDTAEEPRRKGEVRRVKRRKKVGKLRRKQCAYTIPNPTAQHMTLLTFLPSSFRSKNHPTIRLPVNEKVKGYRRKW